MLLPPRPLRLRASFIWKFQLGGLALVAVGVAATIGYAWWQLDALKELLDQSRVWAAGVPAEYCEVSGKVSTTKAIFHNYTLDVIYVDAARKRHQAKLEFSTLVTEMDQARNPVVRYLKDEPGRYALSWAVEAKTSRWASFLFMTIVGVGLVGGSFSFIGVVMLRRVADARRCARRSDEVIVQITQLTPQVVNGRRTGTEYRFSGQVAGARTVTGKVVFSTKEEPLYADAAKQTLVALVAQEALQRPVVLRSDCHPFELTADELAKVRAEIERRSPVAS
jgi:hypothetical protein